MQLLLVIILYFLTPTIATSFLPLRWVLRFWSFIVILVFGISAFETQASISHDGGGGYILGIGILIIYGIILSLIIAFRFAIQKIRKKKSYPQTREIKFIKAVDSFLLAASGIVASFFTFKFLAFFLSASPNGFAIHGALIVISVGTIGITLRFILNRQEGSLFKVLLMALGLLCGTFTFSVIGIFYPYAVIRSAQNIAGESPYCIGLSKRNRPPEAMEDLTLLTMDKGDFDHHAFLLVEKQDGTVDPYHWSYFQSRFLSGIVNWENDNRPSIPCRPKHNFALDLPLTGGISTENVEFYFRDGYLKTGKEYSPHISSNYISIAAIAPNFMPVPREKGGLYPSKEVGSRKWMESLQKQYENLAPTGKVGNLNEIKDTTHHIDWYYRYNESGQLSTAISCYYGGRLPEVACQHRFYRDGAMYTFDHSMALLSQSDAMEEKLFVLFERFKEK